MSDSDGELRQPTGIIHVSESLLADYGGFDIGGLLRRALSGEAVFEPLPPPRRHRCVFCWLLGLLPGHDRCPHGYLDMGCDCYAAD